ncbi:MAG: hypothetical protein ACRBBP_03100 [Bdellovibrionales bacterium]
MKALIIFLFPLTALATAPTLPEGRFEHDDTFAHSTKHQRIFSLRSSTGQKMFKDYKELGYNCGRKPGSWAKCRKVVATNPNQIEFKVDSLKKLSPHFGTLVAVELISESDFVDIYQIQQEVTFEESSTDTYKVYQNHDSGKVYLDIEIAKARTSRFSYNSKTNDLVRLSFEKEKLSKNEHLIHTLISSYK